MGEQLQYYQRVSAYLDKIEAPVNIKYGTGRSTATEIFVTPDNKGLFLECVCMYNRLHKGRLEIEFENENYGKMRKLINDF